MRGEATQEVAKKGGRRGNTRGNGSDKGSGNGSGSNSGGAQPPPSLSQQPLDSVGAPLALPDSGASRHDRRTGKRAERGA